MKSSFKLLIAITAVAAALAGCATPRTVISQDYDFSNLKRIGISKFDNPKNITGIEDLFAQQLIKKGYTTVERSKLDKVLSEQKIQASGLTDPDTAKKLGQLLGVDGLLIGEVTYYSPKQSNTYMAEDDTSFAVPVYKKVYKKNPDGTTSVKIRQTGSNTKVEKHRYPVTVTTYPQIGIVAKIIDTGTGEIVWVGSMLEDGANLMDAEESCVHLLVKSMWKDVKELQKQKEKAKN